MELTNFNRFNDLVERLNLKTALFDFDFIGLKFKCLYIHSTKTFVLSVEQKSTGFAISISAVQTFNGSTPLDFYKNIKAELMKETGDNKITPLFVCLNNKILTINEEHLISASDVQVIEQISLTRHTDKDFDEDCQRPFFENWYRHKTTKKSPSHKNLDKTERYFGFEIKDICKQNRITSQWSTGYSKKSLDLLFLDQVRRELQSSSPS